MICAKVVAFNFMGVRMASVFQSKMMTDVIANRVNRANQIVTWPSDNSSSAQGEKKKKAAEIQARSGGQSTILTDKLGGG